MKRRDQHHPDAARTAVLVLGMHRSGTSALTRLVSLAGAALPRVLLAANPTNPTGHWEPDRIVTIHDELLSTIGSSWDDWRPVDPRWFKSVAARGYSQRLQAAIIEEFGDAPLFVMKDPRVCRLLPLWLSALRSMNIRPVAMLIVRNPLEIAHSLGARDSFSLEKSFLLWLRHVLEAERFSRPIVRCVTSYRQLLSDWPSVLDWAERELRLTWPRRPDDIAGEVAQFISGDLHRSRATRSEFRLRAKHFPWIVDAHTAMEGLMRNPAKATDRKKLDEIRAGFDRAVAAFGSFAVQAAPVTRTVEPADLHALQHSLDVARDESHHALERIDAAVRAQDEHLAHLADTVEGFRDERAVNALQEELTARRQEVEQLKQAASVGRQDAEALQQERLTWVRKVDALQHRASVHSDRVAELQRQLDTRNDDVKGLQQAVHTRQDEVVALKQELAARNRDTDALTQALRAEIDALQARVSTISNLERELGARSREAETLTQDSAARRTEIDALQNQLKSNAGTIGDLERDLTSRRETLRALEQELVASRNELTAYQREEDLNRVEADTLLRTIALQSRMLAGLHEASALRVEELRLLQQPLTEAERIRSLGRIAAPGYARGSDAGSWRPGAETLEPVDPGHGPRFLVVTDAIPTPDLDSGSFRLFQILALLTEIGYRVTFVSHSEEPRADYAEQLRALMIDVVYGPEAALDHLEREGDRYAFVLLSRPEVAFRYLFPVRAYAIHAGVAFDTVDLHWLRMERAAELTGDAELLKQSQYYKRIELFSAAASDLVLAITEPEKAILLEQSPALHVDILPNIHPPAETGRPWPTRRDLMFIGGFWHKPNEDGVCYFVEEILPLIRQELPEVAFNIIGSHMSERVQALASSSVHALGYVPDPTAYFAQSRVFVSPLRYGAGMKGKVGQSMSHGLPVVTTSIGAEGMMLVDGENALIADDAAAFARAVVRLYTDERLWEDLARRSVSHIANHFSAEAARRRLTALFPVESLTVGEEQRAYAS